MLPVCPARSNMAEAISWEAGRLKIISAGIRAGAKPVIGRPLILHQAAAFAPSLG
ncbi:MAG: hypothetical protein DHS20C05_00860 [Hyphococcus sp.]|nr:MAG: hypothetical protein DHS20C05_00860 [Marinicaulis sp.]